MTLKVTLIQFRLLLFGKFFVSTSKVLTLRYREMFTKQTCLWENCDPFLKYSMKSDFFSRVAVVVTWLKSHDYSITSFLRNFPNL